MPHYTPAGYTKNEIERLEQDAVWRAREMQRRSTSRSPSPSPAEKNCEPAKSCCELADCRRPADCCEPVRCCERKEKAEKPSFVSQTKTPKEKKAFPAVSGAADSTCSFFDQISSSLGLDHDRLMVALLFLLLINEECDKTLLFALGYILL